MKLRRGALFFWRDSALSTRGIAIYLSTCALILWCNLRQDDVEAPRQALDAGTFVSFVLLVHGVLALVRQHFRHRALNRVFDAERAAFRHALAEGEILLAKRHLEAMERLATAYAASEVLEPGPGSHGNPSDPRSGGEKGPPEGFQP